MFTNNENFNKLTYVSSLDMSEFYMILKQIELDEIPGDEIIENMKHSYEYLKTTEIGVTLEDTFEEHLVNTKKSFVNELRRRRLN